MQVETYFTIAVPDADLLEACQVMASLDPDIGGFDSFDTIRTIDGFSVCSMPCAREYAQQLVELLQNATQLSTFVDRMYASKLVDRARAPTTKIAEKVVQWLYAIEPLDEFLITINKTRVIEDEVLVNGVRVIKQYALSTNGGLRTEVTLPVRVVPSENVVPVVLPDVVPDRPVLGKKR